MMTKNKTKAISFKIAMVPVLTVALFYLFSCNKEMMPTTANPDSWWIPIAEKHNIKLHGYNGFPDMVEMGTTNSVDNGVARLENAVFIMKDGDEKYIIIKSPLAFHNLKTNLIEGKEGVIEYYSFSSKSTKPAQTIEMKDFQYQIEGSGHKWKAENSTLKVR